MLHHIRPNALVLRLRWCGRFEDVLAHLDSDNYTVPQTAAFERCRTRLSWWHSGLPNSPHAQTGTEAAANSL